MVKSKKKFLAIEQYQTSANLEARIELHERFSTAQKKLPIWEFDQFDLPPLSQILDLGCGTAILWQKNLSRIPAGWRIVLADRSPGMINRARPFVKRRIKQFSFAVADAGAIPFADGRFDAVVANHMLYHVADLGEAFSEISRVLKPAGRLYAATNGENHLRELDDLTPDYIPHQPAGAAASSFTLENGAGLLEPFFPEVERRRFLDSLIVNEPAPLVNYQLSAISIFDVQAKVTEAQKQKFADHVAGILHRRGGLIHITKDSGLFVAGKG